MTNAKDLIMGTSSPAMSFTYPNDSVGGKVLTEPKAVQQTVYDPRNPQSKEPAFWPSGDPKMQVIFQIQTDFRNYEGIKKPDRMQPDTGARTIYLKGKHMEKATADAIRAAGAEWIEVGGMIYFRFIGEDMTSMAGVKPKLFEVVYQRPTAQPPQHFSQPQGQQGYPNQGFGQQTHQHGPQVPPLPTHVGTPGWQQPGWTSQAQQAVPSHHGQADQMPDWARPQSAPPAAPASSPPALSTLDMIRQGQEQTGTPDYGPVDPAF